MLNLTFRLAVSGTGEHIAFISHHGLIVLTGSAKSGKERARIKHMVGERPLTCLAFHPSQAIIASGDMSGRIILWYNITSTRPVRRELHWHEMPVADLSFSALGSELYSGGSENVLVKWQLTSQRKYFLPRLGLPMRFITTDLKNNLIITAHLDNDYKNFCLALRLPAWYPALLMGSAALPLS
ncbi:WD repeat-containing protein 75 [Portunus trituberculatus]|uniref:WD repeat-containing protein 75 n=1 Tax=Portunus trituberculatus TaxID=210409 RepID=A0A5B7H320_PORTR|nr:WD repeat-containing protein 75 [Portunus trituberculatus]